MYCASDPANDSANHHQRVFFVAKFQSCMNYCFACRRARAYQVAIQHRGKEKRKFRVIGLSRLGADQLTFPDSETGTGGLQFIRPLFCSCIMRAFDCILRMTRKQGSRPRSPRTSNARMQSCASRTCRACTWARRRRYGWFAGHSCLILFMHHARF